MSTTARRWLWGTVLLLSLWISAGAWAACPTFPAHHIWNTRVDTLPVDTAHAVWLSRIGLGASVVTDFGSGLYQGSPIGIPVTVVPADQPAVPVTLRYADESDPGPYPIPPNVAIEGGTDKHALIVQEGSCVLYELYKLTQRNRRWRADSGAIFNLLSYALRPLGWTSADAAGLPIFPGLARYDEVATGVITHALRFTAPQTQRAYVWPARHFASSITDPSYPPMGARLRLKASVPLSGFAPVNQVLLQALKTYGMMLADNGSAIFLSGAPDARWNNTELRQLRQVHGSDFEVVDVSPLMIDVQSGEAQQP